MSDREEDIALFDRYLNNEMSDAEHAEFEQRLSDDPAFLESFEWHKDIVEGVKMSGRKSLRSEFAAMQSEIPDQDIAKYKPSRPGGKTWNIMSWIMVIGSVALAVAFVIALTNLPKVEELKERANRDSATGQGEKDTIICFEATVLPANNELRTLLLQSYEGFGEEARGYTLEDMKLTVQMEDTASVLMVSEAIEAESMFLQVCEEHHDKFDFHYRSTKGRDSLLFYGVDAESAQLYHILNLPGDLMAGAGYDNPKNYLFAKYQGEWYELKTSSILHTPLVPLIETSAFEPDSIAAKDTTFIGSVEEMKEVEIMKVDSNNDSTDTEGNVFSATSEKISSDIYEPDDVDEHPQYKGGTQGLNSFLSKCIEYPEKAVEDRITGKVWVRFTVLSDGSVENVSIAKGVHPALNEEAMRVVKLLDGFKPATDEGKNVPCNLVLPIVFTLE